MDFNDHKVILDMPIFKTLSEVADETGTEAYVIGGFVRDLLLGREVKDLDVVTVGNGIDFAQCVSKKLDNQPVKVFKNFGTAMLKFEEWDLEFVGARKESYVRDSRKPEVEPGTLRDDQLRRDFSINALAISLNNYDRGELSDPFNGVADLKSGIIRTPTDPHTTFSDDPLRMMRAIRFATQLGFTIEKSSLAAISEMKQRIEIVSAERISVELNKIIMAKKPSIGFKLLFKTGLLNEFFPELVSLQGVEEQNGIRHKDNFYHTLEVLDNVAAESDNLWLRWSAILHDIAKPPTKRFHQGIGWTFHGHEDKGARMAPKIFKRLKLPLDHQLKYVQKMVALHLRPIALTKEEATDSAIRRLLFDAGDDIDDLMILCKSDITSKNEKKVRKYLSNYERVKERLIEVEEKDKVRNWQPPISGDEIMSFFGIKPSREVGIIKNSIKEAILEGEISNDPEEARQFMLKEGEKLGLAPKN
ncbi:HD domain-containing protein [Cryomorphaceae bacterium 1068]|nr:HD domain-containing protein [Cryomorphaceae bacterium 1068]